MSWLYSRALVEAYSEAISSAGEPSALSSETPTPQAYWSHDRTMERSPRSLSGMMFGRLTADHGAGLLTWFRAASHVRISPSPGMAPASTENEAGYGERWRESFARWDRDTASWRIHQLSLFEDLIASSVAWPRWGTMRGGVCSGRTMPAHLIGETESGSWPTPIVCGNYNRKGASATSGDGLATAVQKWPTPTAHNAKECDAPAESTRNTPTLASKARGGDQTLPIHLNPVWVEWLMGWPLGWTDLRPLETDKFRQWRRLHGEL